MLYNFSRVGGSNNLLSSLSPTVLKKFSDKIIELIQFADKSDYEYWFDSASLRTFKEQVNLYKKGRSIQTSSITVAMNKFYNKKYGKGNIIVLLKGDNVNKDIGIDVVTNAFSGQSYHCYGLAVDIYRKGGKNNLIPLEPDDDLVKYAKKIGLEWGGEWGDFGHFQDNSYKIPLAFSNEISIMGKTFIYNELWINGKTDNIDFVKDYNKPDFFAEPKKNNYKSDKVDKRSFLLCAIVSVIIFVFIKKLNKK